MQLMRVERAPCSLRHALWQEAEPHQGHTRSQMGLGMAGGAGQWDGRCVTWMRSQPQPGNRPQPWFIDEETGAREPENLPTATQRPGAQPGLPAATSPSIL